MKQGCLLPQNPKNFMPKALITYLLDEIMSLKRKETITLIEIVINH